MGYSVQEQAAVKLCRMIARNNINNSTSPWSYGSLMTKLAEIMIEGSPLKEVPPVTAAQK